MDFATLLEKTRRHGSLEPRDEVYALLGLVDEKIRYTIAPVLRKDNRVYLRRCSRADNSDNGKAYASLL